MKKYIAIAIIALSVASCSTTKKKNPEAESLYQQIAMSFNNANYRLTLALIDSLQATYPTEIQLQRDAMQMQPKAIYQQALIDLDSVNAAIEQYKTTIDRLKPQLKWVKLPEMIEGYWVAKDAYRDDFTNVTGLQGRVSEAGEFYLVMSVVPASKQAYGVEATSSAGACQSPLINYDGSSNFNISGSSLINFMPDQSSEIGQFAYDAANNNLTVTYKVLTAKGATTKIPNVKGLALAYDYSQAMANGRKAQIESERLTRVAEIAKSHILVPKPN